MYIFIYVCFLFLKRIIMDLRIMNLELCPLNPQKVGNEESQRFVILNKWIRRYFETSMMMFLLFDQRTVTHAAT